MTNAKECLTTHFTSPEFHETVYVLIHLIPLWLLLAICVSPVLMVLYKRRVTALMSSSEEISDKLTVDQLALVDVADHGRPTQPIREETDEALWSSIRTNTEAFRKNAVLPVALHLLFLLIVVVIANWEEDGESFAASVLVVVVFSGVLGLWSTSIISLRTGDSVLTKIIWLVAVPIIVVGFLIEEALAAVPEVLNSAMAVLYLIVFGAVLHYGISGRKLKNIVPYLTIAIALSVLFMSVFMQLYLASNCLTDTHPSDLTLLMVGFGSLLFGLFVVKAIIRWVADLYRHKKISDRQLQLCGWLIIISMASLMFLQVEDEDSSAVQPIAVLVPFVAFASLVLFLWMDSRKKPVHRPCELLLLRVFSLDDRGEKWLHEVEHFWRHVGPIHLIAGPDLVESAIDPEEVYLFVSGKLKSLFINNNDIALLRLKSVDNEPDPDGRYRINEYFCFDNVWEVVANGLVNQTEVIVLDLRDFDLARVGTAKEINFLSRSKAFPRTLVLIDDNKKIPALITQIERLTGLRISEKQILVADDISAKETVKRLLSLRSQNLANHYIETEATYADYYDDIQIQTREILHKCQNDVEDHQRKKYGFSFIVFTLGCLGMVTVLAAQLLAPLYLLIRNVSWRRTFPLFGATTALALYMMLHDRIFPGLSEFDPFSTPQILSTLFTISIYLVWLVVWIRISQQANRWIAESREPLGKSLRLINQYKSSR